MVSKEPGKCLLTTSESEVEPAASLALEMKYALDPNRQIKKRNKALQVRFKDICEAQNEQRDKQLSTTQDPDKREAKPISYKTAYRKYMTVPARRSIPNVTKSTGVQTSPDLKKCYQTFPLDRKKGNILKSASTVDTFKSQNNGFLIDVKDKDGGSSGEAVQWSKKAGSLQTAEFISHINERTNTGSHDNGAEAWKSSDLHSSPKEPPPPPLPNLADPALEEPAAAARPPGRGKQAAGRPGSEEAAQPLHGRVFKTEVATVYLPAAGSNASQPDLPNLAAETDWSPCPTAEEDKKRTVHLNGVQPQAGDARSCSSRAQCQATECNEQTLQINVSPMEESQPCQTAVAVSEECQQIVPHTEVVDLKAQLQMMENLISSSQETIKVLLGVIQELEKGEAHREGSSPDHREPRVYEHTHLPTESSAINTSASSIHLHINFLSFLKDSKATEATSSPVQLFSSDEGDTANKVTDMAKEKFKKIVSKRKPGNGGKQEIDKLNSRRQLHYK